MTDSPPSLYPGGYLGQFPDKPSIILAESGERLSYAQLHSFASRMARGLQGLGLNPGDHIALVVENRLEASALQWGAHYAGLYYTFISTRLTVQETAYIVDDCDAKAVILTDKTAPALLDVLRDLTQKPYIFTIGSPVANARHLDELINDLPGTPPPDALEGNAMLYSSGTTGRPKGVKPALSGKPLGSTSVIGAFLKGVFGVTPDSIFLCPAPFYHAAPLKWVEAMQAVGGTAVLMERFDAEAVLRAIERYRVTHSLWVPTMFSRLLALPPEVRERYDTASQRVVVHAAAPCPVPVKQSMINWWGPILSEFYSCTEGIGMTFTSSQDWLAHPGTVGRAAWGRFRIVDEQGNEVPPGQDGLVYFTGAPPFSYHKDPEKTKQAYTEDGWATVGDIGHTDEEGFLYLTDRVSHMIISGGVNVYPQEAENILISHPKVLDAAVIGTPHADLGEEVRAVVQLKPGHAPDGALAEELIAYCRSQLSHIKCPRVVDFRDQLPREPTGKLLKRLLRDEYRNDRSV
ncbi:MAG: acyl-CoA synthetase [Pseudoxanthomonas sp.]